MNQELNKLSRNLNVAQTFNDFSLDTQTVDSSWEDLVDYVIENADVFYWLNIESIWGRCGFVWDTYENQGHFNNVSIKFNVLPRIPDPHRIKTFRGLFTNLDARTYTINDNNWEHIDTIGDWGNSNQTLIINMPSATFTKVAMPSRGSSPNYKFLQPIDSLEWDGLPSINSSYYFNLIIDDDNKDIVKLNVSKILNTAKSSRLSLSFLTTSTRQRDIDIFKNIPEIFPNNWNKTIYILGSNGNLSEYTLYRQYINEEETTQCSRTLFSVGDLNYNNRQRFLYWPYPEEDNPPINYIFAYWNPKTLQNQERFFINCKVVPVYRTNYIHNDQLDIPQDYDIFNNPNHKVKYYNNGNIINGTAYWNNLLQFSTKLNLRCNVSLMESMYYPPTFHLHTDQPHDFTSSLEHITLKSIVEELSTNEDIFRVFRQDENYYEDPNGIAYSTSICADTGITFYDDSKAIHYSYNLFHLYDVANTNFTVNNRKVNYKLQLVRTDPDHQLILEYASGGYVILNQDIIYKTGLVIFSQDTQYKIVFNSSSSTLRGAIVADCVIGKATIPNIFDFSDTTLKEGYEVQDLVGFKSFNTYLYSSKLKSPNFITVDSTLDFILQGILYLVNKPTKSVHDVMKLYQRDDVFSYPLNRVKQIGTPDDSGHKIHLEGGYVLSLDENATVGDAEGVEYFLSKFKFREGAQPKENSLFLNSEQYALFTQEQIKLLNDNGWEVIEVIIS